MKLTTITAVVFCGALLAGCSQNQNVQKNESKDTYVVNKEIVNSLNNIGIENAIIAQHTLFPYHFVKNSAELNELGQKDLAVLAKHLSRCPGDLNVRKADTPDDIYQARVDIVIDRLKKAGMPADQIRIVDGIPGGDGMVSERVVKILDKADKTTLKTSTGSITAPMTGSYK